MIDINTCFNEENYTIIMLKSNRTENPGVGGTQYNSLLHMMASHGWVKMKISVQFGGCTFKK